MITTVTLTLTLGPARRMVGLPAWQSRVLLRCLSEMLKIEKLKGHEGTD